MGLFGTQGSQTAHRVETIQPRGQRMFPHAPMLSLSLCPQFTHVAEYQHPVGPPGWRMAMFAAAGNPSARWQDWTPRLGLGAGLRWDSPIGPVGLDIARGQYTKQWQWNLSLGASF